MDRVIVWPGSTPLDVDVLQAEKNGMMALGFALLDMLGPGTSVTGLGGVPTGPPSLAVSINPGRLYSLQNVDTSAYGAIAADTNHQIVKQGILLDAAILAITPPVTAGQSINYLIEATFSEVDTDLIVLPYYNSANTTQTFAGPNNSNNPQATLRQGQIVLQAKPGTPATTGSQTTPAPDSSYLGLWVVTVAHGDSAITSGAIAQYSGTSILSPVLSQSGSFTLTGTGFSGTAPTVSCFWRTVGSMVTLSMPSLSGTSNLTSFAATGLPAALQPAAGTVAQLAPIALSENNSAFVAGACAQFAASSGTISFSLLGNFSGWTASGTKAAAGNFTYARN